MFVLIVRAPRGGPPGPPDEFSSRSPSVPSSSPSQMPETKPPKTKCAEATFATTNFAKAECPDVK